jgi:amino acid transporter
VDWGLLLNSLFWNLNGFDATSTLASEVQDPSYSFPRALKAGLVLVALQYVIPMVLGVGADTNIDKGEWSDDNEYAEIGRIVSMPLLFDPLYIYIAW